VECAGKFTGVKTGLVGWMGDERMGEEWGVEQRELG
jgi:hypothetical protein